MIESNIIKRKHMMVDVIYNEYMDNARVFMHRRWLVEDLSVSAKLSA